MRTFFAVALIVALPAVFSACRSTPEPVALADECSSGADCLAATPFCVDGTCLACMSPDHCELGQTCVDGSCAAIDGFCQADADCPSPQRCLEERCGPECVVDADCSGEERCRSGECRERVASCEMLDTIYFDFDEALLSSSARRTAEDNLASLAACPRGITIEGHADERGTEEYNLALGDRRARSVQRFFVDGGAVTSIRTVSYGELRPAVVGHHEEAWSQNRRAAFQDQR